MTSIPFNQLAPAHVRLRPEIDAAIARVLERAYYILGPEVEAFEAAFAVYHGVRHAIGVANGTDAIELALRAAGISAGDEVITVAHTAVPTVCAVERAGAVPVLVDIDPTTYTLDPAAVEAAITPRTRALLPVHLYGHPAHMDAILDIAERHGLLVIEDCAQAHGARWRGQRVGTFGHMAAFSFYPTKNLGAYGDGGAILTDDDGYAQRLRALRNYGQTTRYVHETRGLNSRLDELQAAILTVKLAHLDAFNAERQAIAAAYDVVLADLPGLTLPTALEQAEHVYHLYVVRAHFNQPDHPRDRLMDALKARGIGTAIHYPTPVHLQAAYADLGYPPGSLPHTEAAAREIVSLPLYIGLTQEEVAHVAANIADIVRQFAAESFQAERIQMEAAR